MRCLTGFFCVITAFATSAPAQTNQPEQSIKTTLCDVKTHPENYIHKLVEVTTTASHGFEDSTMSLPPGEPCLPNNGLVGLPMMWMEFGGTNKTDTMYCCGYTIGTTRPEVLKVEGIEIPLVDDALFKSFNQRLHVPPKKREGSTTVNATLIGRIFAHKEDWGNNHPYWGGYGHMGCCMLFVVTKVVAVDPLPEKGR